MHDVSDESYKRTELLISATFAEILAAAHLENGSAVIKPSATATSEVRDKARSMLVRDIHSERRLELFATVVENRGRLGASNSKCVEQLETSVVRETEGGEDGSNRGLVEMDAPPILYADRWQTNAEFTSTGRPIVDVRTKDGCISQAYQKEWKGKVDGPGL